MTTSIKGVLFDKDGTLFNYGNTWEIWCERVIAAMAPGDMALQHQLARGVGFDLNSKDFVPGSLVVNASVDEINQAWENLHPTLSSPEIKQLGIRQLQDLPVVPVCDLRAMLQALKQMGMAVGCATNDFEASAMTQLEQAEIKSEFDFICGYDSGHGAKPEPGMLHAFARTMQLQPGEVVMVGDSTHDLNCGIAAGAALCVGVLTGPALHEDLAAKANVVLASVAELPAYLRGISG
ncbi:MAG: HAD family hydrolase [Thiolinea sp.]